jgi:hypothetical protein
MTVIATAEVSDDDQISQLYETFYQQRASFGHRRTNSAADNGYNTTECIDLTTKTKALGDPPAEISNENQTSLWTEVARQQLKSRSHRQLTNFQQSLIAAVYRDQTDEKRRESSLIISGCNLILTLQTCRLSSLYVAMNLASSLKSQQLNGLGVAAQVKYSLCWLCCTRLIRPNN